MTSPSTSRSLHRRAICPCLLVLAMINSGCAVVHATEPAHPQTAALRADHPNQASQEGAALVTRAGRYTLIELNPDDAQRVLMQQLVQTSIPASMDTTVGDGLRFLLSRTGYRICDSVIALDLYAMPLPAAHFRLGPMTLRQALLTVIGPAWALQVNEASRQVCVIPIDGTEPLPASSARKTATTVSHPADRTQSPSERQP